MGGEVGVQIFSLLFSPWKVAESAAASVLKAGGISVYLFIYSYVFVLMFFYLARRGGRLRVNPTRAKVRTALTPFGYGQTMATTTSLLSRDFTICLSRHPDSRSLPSSPKVHRYKIVDRVRDAGGFPVLLSILGDGDLVIPIPVHRS